MTEEQLEKIIETSERIKHYKKFFSSFMLENRNNVVSIGFDGKPITLSLEKDRELYELVRDHIWEKITQLEKELYKIVVNELHVEEKEEEDGNGRRTDRFSST